MMTFAEPGNSAGPSPAVATVNLGKRYGTHHALREVNLQVPLGAFYLLVGANGAGKSTLIKVLLDLVRASAGAAQVFGLDARTQGAEVRANIGYVPERSDWAYAWMSVERLLAHHARYFPTWDTSYARRLCTKFDVQSSQRMGTLSKGQARRVHLIMALAHYPPLLLLDEPTDGLDPVMRDETLAILAEHMAETETTVLMATHHVAEIEQFADHAGVLRGGRLRTQLPVAELQRTLLRYRVHMPSVWNEASDVGGTVLKRSNSGREMEWTVQGDEAAVRAAFARSGAHVIAADPLSLVDATLLLLTVKD